MPAHLPVCDFNVCHDVLPVQAVLTDCAIIVIFRDCSIGFACALQAVRSAAHKQNHGVGHVVFIAGR